MPTHLGKNVDLLAKIGDQVQRRRRDRLVLVIARQRRGLVDRLLVTRRSPLPGHDHVDHAHDRADQKQAASEYSDPVERHQLQQRFGKIAVAQQTGGIEVAPHQTLGESGHVDRNDVEQNARGTQPEVGGHPLAVPQVGLEQPGEKPVDHPEGHEAVPAQGAGMHVSDRPIGVVGQRVDALDRKHRAFEGAHPVEGHADDEELENRILGHLVPCAAEREQAVEHPAPRRHPEHQRKQHAGLIAVKEVVICSLSY